MVERLLLADKVLPDLGQRLWQMKFNTDLAARSPGNEAPLPRRFIVSWIAIICWSGASNVSKSDFAKFAGVH